MVAYIDEVTHKCTGIICDICNKILKDKFLYYSSKFDLIEVDRNACSVGPKSVDRRYLDLDFCVECMEQMKTDVKHNIELRAGQSDKSKWTTKP